ncbi:MAG: complex I NDUFA9 subunit family protein [Rubrivivax sp.]
MKGPVAVLGGTGFVGHAVCEHLVERSGGAGGRVVVPTRRLRHGLAIQSLPTVQLVQADVHDDQDLARVLAGCEAVVHLVAILHGSEAEFDRVHVQLPRRVAAACKAAGVRRAIHVSALGAATDAPSRYLRSKAAGEKVWRESGLDVTMLRPSVIFGARDRFLNLFAQLQALAPFVPLGGAHARFQPVWVEDVAKAVVRCLDQPATIGQVFECAGPQQFTLADLVRLAGRLSGHPRPVLPLPGALARLQALVMECLPGQPLMSRDNVDSMRVPNVATPGQPGLAALGVQASGVEGVAAGYLGGVDGPGRYMPWRSRHR